MTVHKIWALSDWHLPHDSMNTYGEVWINHDEKILENIAKSCEEGDLILIPGDFANAFNQEMVAPMLQLIDKIPCRVLICPGNHDVWYPSDEKSKINLPKNVTLLDGECIKIGNAIIGGTMFWCFKDAFPWEGHCGLMNKLAKHQTQALRKVKAILNEFKIGRAHV